jgi:hypothetical protein
MSVVTLGELRRGFVLLPEGKRRTELEHCSKMTFCQRFKIAFFRSHRRLPSGGVGWTASASSAEAHSTQQMA